MSLETDRVAKAGRIQKITDPNKYLSLIVEDTISAS